MIFKSSWLLIDWFVDNSWAEINKLLNKLK